MDYNEIEDSEKEKSNSEIEDSEKEKSNSEIEDSVKEKENLNGIKTKNDFDDVVRVKGPQRKSKLNALEEIRSETQRLIRESHVSLPYHRPKQRSLTEFLNRRKSIAGVALQTPVEELTKVWKQIEKREKEAESFYKSESEDECESVKFVLKTSEKEASNVNDLEKDDNSPRLFEINESFPDDKPENCNFIGGEKSLTGDLPNINNFDETLQLNSKLIRDDIAEIPEAQSEQKRTESFSSSFESIDLQLSINDGELTTNETALQNIKQTYQESLKYNETEVKENSFPALLNTLNKFPRLSGLPDDLIDLEEPVPIPGPDDLMKRFLKHAAIKTKRKNEKDVSLSVMSSELNDKGEIVNIKEEMVKVKVDESPKPGKKLVALKASLQQKMALLREQQLAKKKEADKLRLEEEGFYEGEKEICDDEEFDDKCSDTESSSEDENDNEDENGNGDEQDNDNENKDQENVKCSDRESSSEDESDNEDQSEQSKSSDEEEDYVKSKFKRKNNFIDSEAEETDKDLEDNNSQDSSISKHEAETVDPGSVDDDEQSLSEISFSKESSFKIPNLEEVTQTEEQIDEGLLSLCSGKFATQPLKMTDLEGTQEKESLNLYLSFTEDSLNQDKNNAHLEKCTEITDKAELSDDDFGIIIKKKSRKLSFSDDDEEEEEKVDIELDHNDSGDDNLLENEEEFEDEETELARKISRGFLDKEAELSESEWGSDDEDERDLDKFEEEEGDKDHINERKLQKELGKIHMREIMAEDKREIRMLQELLLDDGDLHSDGPKRQRLFRWTNQDDNTIDQHEQGEKDENEVQDEDEESWRLQRIERENYLKEKKIDNLSVVESDLNLNISKSTIKLAPKINISITSSPDPNGKFKLLTNRGSFLKRGEKILTKIAELTNTKENPLGNNRGNSNMVFKTLSPPKEELKKNNELKRKCEDFIPSSKKKIKLDKPANKISILELLKQSD